MHTATIQLANQARSAWRTLHAEIYARPRFHAFPQPSAASHRVADAVHKLEAHANFQRAQGHIREAHFCFATAAMFRGDVFGLGATLLEGEPTTALPALGDNTWGPFNALRHVILDTWDVSTLTLTNQHVSPNLAGLGYAEFTRPPLVYDFFRDLALERMHSARHPSHETHDLFWASYARTTDVIGLYDQYGQAWSSEAEQHWAARAAAIGATLTTELNEHDVFIIALAGLIHVGQPPTRPLVSYPSA